jgi:TRAP-type C4-dicarboxylate transport system substrate-binding protein
VVPTYEELASRNRDLDERVRTLEALLRAEQDRAAMEREQREALADTLVEKLKKRGMSSLETDENEHENVLEAAG